jgi:DNA-directed RNA polymerase subunit L
MKKADKILYKEKEYNDKNKGATKLIFNIKGDCINDAVVNTLRRSISEVPIYNFDIFNFETNDSIFHNGYLELRLRNMPVWGIKNDLVFFKSSENENNKEESDEETEFDFDTNKNIDTSTLKQLTMYIDYKNNSNNIVTVSTEHAQFYFAQEKINNPYYKHIPIVKLQPNQEISFSAISNINTEKNNPLYAPCSVCFFKQNSENDYDFIIESRGQITEKRIINVVIQNIIKNMNNILKELKNHIYEDEGIIIINKENHTMGNLIARGLQQHTNIEFAGYKMPHPLSNIIHIHYKINKINIIKAIEDIVDYYTDLFNQFHIFLK